MKLNLGCGKRNFGKDWIHIDGSNYEHIHSHDIENLPFEEFWILLLNQANVVIGQEKISVGGVSGTVVDAKIIFKTIFTIKFFP